MWFKTGSVEDGLIFGGQHELIAWFLAVCSGTKLALITVKLTD
tara:strand:+ start:55441 stop:55569 length:129 start_codon:yes stop_codon:yes gene_type:complete